MGGGPAAHHFVETLHRRDDHARYRVTLISEEDMAPYDRVQLAKRWDKSYDLTLGDPTLWACVPRTSSRSAPPDAPGSAPRPAARTSG
ncbi:hypothetical protein [Kocuria sabuli]|uniref:hypothetical protein n=1 Tax=Kocuria sabuli TaxID=3071448 RepID=UPI0034D61D69